MGATECFQIRKLLWDELKLNIPTSEEAELRSVLGSHFIEENENLRQELAMLVEILHDFQQQNDDIRDALTKRPHLPEPPGRPLLIEKLKLLTADMHHRAGNGILQSSKNAQMLEYVLSTDERSTPYTSSAPTTSKRNDLTVRLRTDDQVDGIDVRPDTRSSKRVLTADSQRPVSRSSTLSISSITAMFESSENLRCLNLDELDKIKEDLRKALDEEHDLLLDDIEFIQGCLEMEKDLIDDDRRKVAMAKPPPSLSDLHEFRKTLEKSIQDQETLDRMESIVRKADNSSHMRVLTSVPLASGRHPISSLSSALPSPTRSGNGSTTRVLKIRHIVQECRDEPYLS